MNTPSTDTALAFVGVTHRYGRTVAVDDLSLDVGAGEVVCLVGPSGCGKSTTLRLAAGLELLQVGRIDIGGRTVAGKGPPVPPEARRTGMVFQDFALFPHLSVIDNVVFGLRDGDSGERRRRGADLLERVGMARYAESYPHELSGGEQQRVALARALAPRPKLMLMDEPFSGLDTQLRDAVRDDTLTVLAEARTPTLLVTHDPREAMRMADRVAVLRDGKLVQVAAPADIYDRPASLFVARFFGAVNTLVGMARDGEVETPLGKVSTGNKDMAGRVVVGIRNEGLLLGAEGTSASVLFSRVLGPYSVVELQVGGGARLTAHIPGTEPPEPDSVVYVDFDRDRAFVFGEDTPNK